MTAAKKNPNVGGVWITASTKDQLKVERALFKAWNAERLSKAAGDRLQREWKPGSDAPAETRADAEAAADKYKAALKAAGRAVATFANRYGEDEARALGYLNPVHWTGNPSARANPEIGEYPEEMATAIIPPTSFALLGELVEIQIEGKRGGVRTIRPRSNAAALLASTPRAGAGQHGSDLWIVWPTSARKTRGPRGADARAAGRIFRRWSKFDPRVSIKMQVGDDGPRHKLGRVLVIRYRSDKWTGEPVLYEHKFTGRKFAYADKKTSPRMILIMNTDGGEMVTERGIVG